MGFGTQGGEQDGKICTGKSLHSPERMRGCALPGTNRTLLFFVVRNTAVLMHLAPVASAGYGVCNQTILVAPTSQILRHILYLLFCVHTCHLMTSSNNPGQLPGKLLHTSRVKCAKKSPDFRIRRSIQYPNKTSSDTHRGTEIFIPFRSIDIFLQSKIINHWIITPAKTGEKKNYVPPEIFRRTAAPTRSSSDSFSRRTSAVYCGRFT